MNAPYTTAPTSVNQLSSSTVKSSKKGLIIGFSILGVIAIATGAYFIGKYVEGKRYTERASEIYEEGFEY